MIKTLRQDGDVILHVNILGIKDEEKESTARFLADEFREEALEYPYKAPVFSPEAALWAAETVYVAAQLILFRKHETTELEQLFPVFNEETSPSAILSADLCLRFVPDMIEQLKQIDPEDALVPILENKLQTWHYSGIGYPLKVEEIDFGMVFKDECQQQLYLNRVIEFKNINIANDSRMHKQVSACLGMYGSEYWKDFNNKEQ